MIVFQNLTSRLDGETRSLLYGLLGVVGFSLTLPATRVAVMSINPMIVGMGRVVVAGSLAAILLTATRQPLPARHYLGSFCIIACCVGFGFPLLSAWAMTQVPSAHGGVVMGIIPLATAAIAAWRVGERPSRSFWLAGIIGSGTVIAFSLRQGTGHLQLGDLYLLGSTLAAAVGYAEGGRLARVLGGWQVISWALVLAAPIIAIPFLFMLAQHGIAAPPVAWAGFAYVAIISQFLAFFPWYRGMALGGIARVGQVQLIQPFLTIVASAVLLHEHITLLTVAAALVVVASVWAGRKARVTRPLLQEEMAKPLGSNAQ